MKNTRSLYIGTFLIAAIMLVIQICLTRILSVMTWYYLVFFAISIAMIGMTAGALTVYFKQSLFEGSALRRDLARFSLALAWFTPLALVFLLLNPMGKTLDSSVITFFAIFTAGIVCMVPFYFSGVAIAGVLTRGKLPVGKIYAADLGGAAVGCLLVLVGLHFFDPMSLVLLSSALAAIAAVVFTLGVNVLKGLRLLALISVALLGAATALNSISTEGIRPLVVKENYEDKGAFALVKWNVLSRITLSEPMKGVWFWGASKGAVGGTSESEMKKLVIDGGAITYMHKMHDKADVGFLYYDVTNFAHYLNRRGLACIVGVGGGRDVQSALIFGYPNVLGIEINPIFVNLLKGPYAAYTAIGRDPRVTIVNDEARSYLARPGKSCAFLQMSLIDTWAATSAGAYSLSENVLYTKEAAKVFLDKLAPTGILSITRWYLPDMYYETGRLLSLLVNALFEYGIEDPSKHIAIVKGGSAATVMVSKTAFSAWDINRIKGVSGTMGFGLIAVPGEKTADPALAKILSSKSEAQLNEHLASLPVDISPPTDDNPYFFNILKRNWDILGKKKISQDSVYVGNIKAYSYFFNLVLSLLVCALLTFFVPIVVKEGRNVSSLLRSKRFWAGGFYFMAIGMGFMLVEISLIQKFGIYLGHPVYALAVILFTLILSTGAGSFLSEKINLRQKIAQYYPLVIGATMFVWGFLLAYVIPATIHWSSPARIFVTILVLAPLGMLMGLCFPIGMRMIKKTEQKCTPWFWSLNGIMGVLGSCLAVVVSIFSGISTCMILAAVLYLLLYPAVRILK